MAVPYSQKPNTDRFSIPGGDRFWFGAGPSEPFQSVWEMLAKKPPAHTDEAAVTLMDRMSDLGRYLLQTDNKHTYPMPFNGQLAIQTAIELLMHKVMVMVVPESGLFSQRIIEIATPLGIEVNVVKNELGKAVDPAAVRLAIEEELRSHSPEEVCLAFVAVDTSQGTEMPTSGLVNVAEDFGISVIIDAITAAPGPGVIVDELGQSGGKAEVPLIVVTCGQKRIGGVPGTSLITINDLAWRIVTLRITPFTTWVCDLPKMVSMMEKRAYHFTVPMACMQATFEAMRLIAEIGIEEFFEMQRRASDGFEAAIAAMSGSGIGFAYPRDRSQGLKAVGLPDSMAKGTVVSRMFDADGPKIKIDPAGGDAPFVRIGLLAPRTLGLGNLEKLFQGLCLVFAGLGHRVDEDAVVAELQRAYND